MRVFVVGMGAVSPAGPGCQALKKLWSQQGSFLRPLQSFWTPEPMPVGHTDIHEQGQGPRSHRLARLAADEAVQGCAFQPQAVVLGGTTGGMDVTEDLLRQGVRDPAAYRLHGTGTVAEDLATRIQCPGPAMTVSTACSSGAVALKLAVQLLRAGEFQCILAGGADALCRLTYQGFKSLQLVDPRGASPFDVNRRGMSVGEAAACMVLMAAPEPPPQALAEVAGCGLSCDASHPTAPHPQGWGAEMAMQLAFQDAGLGPKDIDYVNMHGTGTTDGDLSESQAFVRAFSDHAPPAASSVKGALGHSLGASGALEAVISVLALHHGTLPGTAGCHHPDPELGWEPLLQPAQKKTQVVLSNSFGFGGNNAAVILRRPGTKNGQVPIPPRPLAVQGAACLTGAGDCRQSLDRMRQARSCAGPVPDKDILSLSDFHAMRRMKRLSRLALSLAAKAQAGEGEKDDIKGIFWGTGWGPLSETYDFLSKLEKTGDKFSSPTDFMGSVHNAPAGYMAMYFQCHGPNITCTTGNISFEQALYAAGRMADTYTGNTLVAAADEYHQQFSPLLDPCAEHTPADGGGALLLTDAENAGGPRIHCPCLMRCEKKSSLPSFLESIQEAGDLQERFGAVWAGLPDNDLGLGGEQLHWILERSGFQGPVVDYRSYVGQFATAAAPAAVLALQCVQNGRLPGAMLDQGRDLDLADKGIVLLGLGRSLSCIHVLPPVSFASGKADL
ncbi:MAG: beta-ketoacyl synthase N-terminal-like domain-containing protein [Thermodesulfobacteriota bacterium]